VGGGERGEKGAYFVVRLERATQAAPEAQIEADAGSASTLEPFNPETVRKILAER
jgi:hypothetical protein